MQIDLMIKAYATCIGTQQEYLAYTSLLGSQRIKFKRENFLTVENFHGANLPSSVIYNALLQNLKMQICFAINAHTKVGATHLCKFA